MSVFWERTHFQIARLGDVYRKLAGEQPEGWHKRFRSSTYFHRYVVERMPSDSLLDEGKTTSVVRPVRGRASGFRQAWVLVRRYLSIWRGDRQALLAMLGQSLLVAILLGSVFGNLGDVSSAAERLPQTKNLILLLAVSGFWFGCNTAAKELVKERVIFVRERDFNLRVGSYFASKFLVLALIAVVQATLLFLIVRVWCRPPGPAVLQWLTLAALAVAGTTVGLLISALARSEEVATALVPIAVIPQIILAGVVAPLNGFVRFLSKGFISVHSVQQALERLLPEADRTFLGRQTGGFLAPFAIVLGQAAVGAAATVLVLWRTKGKTASR